MTLRAYLRRLEARNQIAHITRPISKTYEIAGVLKKMEPRAALFENIIESPFRAAGNLFCSKAAFADYFDIPVNQLIPLLSASIDHRTPPEMISSAACQEVVDLDPDLNRLPILRHCALDGGNYISSGVVIARHPVHGQNLDFHRMMQFSPKEMAVRVVRGRHFDAFLRDCRQIDVAICIGNAPNVLAAAATSVELGINELEIANALELLQVIPAKTVDVLVPAESEFVLEGTITSERTYPEGPFVDLTETYDIVRQEPVFTLKAVTHRQDAIWHALLPGALEHKLLMGMPREPTIYKKVNEVTRCLDVNIAPGGCSWLHAIVQIDKQGEEDGRRAIQAAFAGHRSCKHVFVVDKDIDIYNPLEVEWAMATRFQGDQDLIVLERAPGSSLDPSATPGSHDTTRVGFDLTRPLETHGKSYEKAPFPEIDLEPFLNP